MNILIACEFSGIVRDAFAAKGHYAVSCDLLPTERPGLHFQNDVRIILNEGWDMMIAHPPCTYLSNAGANHFYIGKKKKNGVREDRLALMREAAQFFNTLLNAPIPMIAIENPIMIGIARELVGKPYDQIIQPYQFGHKYSKKTCLWLKGLPLLSPTEIYKGRIFHDWVSKGHHEGGRQQSRSRTFLGIAAAMADQWG